MPRIEGNYDTAAVDLSLEQGNIEVLAAKCELFEQIGAISLALLDQHKITGNPNDVRSHPGYHISFFRYDLPEDAYSTVEVIDDRGKRIDDNMHNRQPSPEELTLFVLVAESKFPGNELTQKLTTYAREFLQALQQEHHRQVDSLGAMITAIGGQK